MAVKPRKKEPTLAELLAQYGRNIASDVPVVGRRIAEGVRSLPEVAAAGNRAMLGATQRVSDMLPPVLQMPGVRGDYRPSIDEVTGLARDAATGGSRLVTGTAQRALDALGAPRGAGYDLPAAELSRMAQDVAVSGAQALPEYMYEHPLDSAYTAALMMAPTPGRVVRGARGLETLAGRALRGEGRAAPLAVVERAAAAPQLFTQAKIAPLKALQDIRPSTDDVYAVMNANTTAGKVTGNKMLPIDKLSGGITAAADDARRVDQLVKEMSAPEGYVSRLIVDDAGNVIEGQHRLEALRRLGVPEVPVTQYVDLERAVPFLEMRDAAASQGVHPDQANQIAKNLAEIYADEGGDMAEVLQYSAPKGFEKAWGAALNTMRGKTEMPPLAAKQKFARGGFAVNTSR